MELENRGQIVNGPNKFDLMLSLFVGKHVTFTIEFKDGGDQKALIKTQINSIEAEDGSRESWNLTGGIVGIGKFFRNQSAPMHEPEPIEWRNFRAYFQTRRRSGVIFY